jgi:hypothetical protein
MKLAIFRNKKFVQTQNISVQTRLIASLLLCCLLLLATGCSKYNDSEVWDTLYNLTLEQQQQAERLAALEAWVNIVNENISALQTLVDALQNNDYITGVTSFDTPAPGGYYIDFNKSDRITIRNGNKGEDGKDGKDGETGKDGEDGEKGKDGETPRIGVRLDNGIYYWTLNDEWLKDSDGNNIPATGPQGNPGEDGEDGKDGKDGKNGAAVAIGSDGNWYICASGTCTGTPPGEGWTNTGVKATGNDGAAGQPGAAGVTPKLRINAGTNYWQVCVSGTCNATDDAGWENILGSDGQPVKATGPKGDDGAQGGDAIFAPNGVDDSHDDYVEFTLADLSTIQVPKYKPLGIVFTPPGKVAPGASAPITYTLTGSVQTVKIMDMPQGWTAANTLNAGKTGGTFTVTAPAAFFSGNQSGEAIIFVSDGAERIIFRDIVLTGAYLWTNITQITTAAAAANHPIAVTSNGSWTATVSAGAAWCTLSPAIGTNSGNLTVTTAANSATADRAATVTMADDYTTVTIPVMQQGNRPPNAASERTWVYGGRTWSDYINVAACNKADFTASTGTANCLSHTRGADTYYYYNGKYVDLNGASLLCPAPWRIPTSADFGALVTALKGAGAGLSLAWGLPSYADAEAVPVVSDADNGSLWSATKSGDNVTYLTYGWSAVATSDYGNPKLGMAVRCVHD